MRNADRLIDFDMDLAKSQSADNPSIMQYAHARICSILPQAGDNWQQGSCVGLLSTEAEKAADAPSGLFSGSGRLCRLPTVRLIISQPI